MKTIWPKATKWTGIVLFLIAFTCLMVQVYFVDWWSNRFYPISDVTTYNKHIRALAYHNIWVIVWGILLLMSTLLFIGGLIAEQIGRKKDE
jgi:hypothetical membrane protein